MTQQHVTQLAFTTSGPCSADDHYMLNALARIPTAKDLCMCGNYFVIQGQLQSGKTTALLALADEINNDGQYYAMHFSLEPTHCSVKIYADIFSLASAIKHRAIACFPEFSSSLKAIPINQNSQIGILITLSMITESLDRPLVVLLDQIDCLPLPVLLSFLSQLRIGYVERKMHPFPKSIAFVDIHDIRYFTIQKHDETESRISPAPFNIISKILTLRNFTLDEVRELYGQHTAATQQIFDEDAIQRTFYWTDGQPWLTNAIAKEIIEKMLHNDYSIPITANLVDEAVDAISKRMDSHIFSLISLLSELRVRNVVEPLLSGENIPQKPIFSDSDYCSDIGLVKSSDTGRIVPANRIYADLMMRHCACGVTV